MPGVKFKLLAGLAILVAGFVAKAQTNFVPVPITVAMVANVQVMPTAVNGVQINHAAVRYSISSKSLAAAVWAAEWNLGNVNTESNVLGAKLVLLVNPNKVQASHFAFYSDALVVCDCSDVLTWDCPLYGVETGGKVNLTNFTVSQEKFAGLSKITFDNTGAGGDLSFQIYGLSSWTANDVISPGGLNYTETMSFKTTVDGGGKKDGQIFYISSGTFSGSGKTLISF
jgi:hypothetical protein